MIIINAKAVGCSLEVSQPIVASGSAGKVRVCFTFDGEWSGLAKTAVFHTQSGNILVPLTNDKCDLPYKTLEKCGNVRFGVFGTNGEQTVTTVFKSIYVDGGVPTVGESAANYTAGIYELLSAKIAKIEGMTVSAQSGESADAKLLEKNGVLELAITLPRGEKGDSYTLTAADREELKRYVDLYFGDVGDAINEIIALQQQLIGGNA